MSENELSRIDYDTYSFNKDLNQIRGILLLSAIMYGLFALVDLTFHNEVVGTLHIIRYVFVMPVLLISIGLSFTPFFKKMHQTILFIDYLAAGIGIVSMIVIIGGQNLYYGGLYLVMAVAFFLLRLKPHLVLVATMLIILSYLMLSFVFAETLLETIGLNLIFISSFSLIGIVGAFLYEGTRRKQYYYEIELLGENIVLNKEVYNQYEDLKHLHQSSIISIAKLAEARDDFTAGHVNRVGELSKMLAMKLPDKIYEFNQIDKDEFVSTISLSSTLHDIGKIAISDTILNKKGPLTEIEYKLMKTHTAQGYEILKEIQNELKDNVFLELGVNIARYHHEWWNGEGYPTKIKGTNIPMEARIVAVVDVYDALISERPYKSAFSKEKSIQLIKEGIGTQFDPMIARIMIDLATESTDEEMFGISENKNV